jgi:hypothetical protein
LVGGERVNLPNWDRIKWSLLALVSQATARFDFHAFYAATVKSQGADGSLGLVFDDARFPPMDGVPIRLGLPGVTVKVSSGSRVLVGFENGDPSKPRASLWDVSGLVEIAFAGGTQPVARKGDPVRVGKLMGSNTAGPVLFSVVPEDFDPDIDTPPTPTALIDIAGTIQDGAPKVKA